MTVFSANRQPCANLKRAPENTPILGNIGNGGSGHTKRKIAQENEPLSKSRKVKPNWTPLCPSPRKKRKQVQKHPNNKGSLHETISSINYSRKILEIRILT